MLRIQEHCKRGVGGGVGPMHFGYGSEVAPFKHVYTPPVKPWIRKKRVSDEHSVFTDPAKQENLCSFSFSCTETIL